MDAGVRAKQEARAEESEAMIYRDVMVDCASCIFDTSAVHGGRMPRVQGRTGAAIFMVYVFNQSLCKS